MDDVKRVLKWPVAVDDKAHEIGAGPVVRVACQNDFPGTVYVWTEEYGEPTPTRRVQVFGTGHLLPVPSQHVGSTECMGLVWHLYAVSEVDQ